MADVTTSTNHERTQRVAVERIVGFAKQFGEVHLNLACHAAFPLVLTPDLLYQIWAHFVPEAPWTAVARVLLSRLCRQVGYEMYEMDIPVRNLLLKELKEQFGQEQLEELGEFLLDYVAYELTSDDEDTRDVAQAQEWTALAYTKPSEAARDLAQALQAVIGTQKIEISEALHLASLVETLAEPLVEVGFQPLLIYSQGIKSFIFGNLEHAAALFDEVLDEENQVQVAGVRLSVPEQFFSKTLEAKDLEDLQSRTDSLVASERGLVIVDQAREEIGWTKADPLWIKAANTSETTLQRFWRRLPIARDAFIAICNATGNDNWEDITRTGHFSTLRTIIKDPEPLKAALRDLGITVKTNTDIRGSDGQKIQADIVAILEGECDLGWSRNSDGSFHLIVDLWGVGKKYNQTELINSIYQKYRVNQTLKDKEVKQQNKNLKWQKRKCPRCDSTQVVKYGYSQGKQNYKCQNCGTQFWET